MAHADVKPLRAFATKPFMRFAEQFGADKDALWDTLQGACDADLGGGVFKYRLARDGGGTSGGARAIVAMKSGERVVMMYGFEKKDLANITPKELVAFKKAARIYLGLSEKEIAIALKEKAFDGNYKTVCRSDEGSDESEKKHNALETVRWY